MRALGWIVFVIVAIVALNFYVNHMLLTTQQQIDEQMALLESAALADDWAQAGACVERAMDAWNLRQRRWQIFINHNEVEAVDTMLRRLLGHAKAEDIGNLLPDIYEVRARLEHIVSKQRVTFANLM